MAFQEVEQNGTLSTANLVAVNTTFQGSMGANSDHDYFKIQLSAGGLLTMNFTHPNGAGTSGGNIRLMLKDTSGDIITYKDFTGNGQLEGTVPSSGDYYVEVWEADGTASFTAGIYSVATSFVSDPNTAYDGFDNSSIGTAINKLADGVTPLTSNNVLKGSLGSNSDRDYFKVPISTSGPVSLYFTHPNGVGTAGGGIMVLIHNSSNGVVASQVFTGNGRLDATVPSAGDYYVDVWEADNAATFTEGIYSISLSSSASSADTSAPSVGTFSPADEASGVAVGSNVVLTFSEAIQRGNGNILLKTVGGTTVASYDAATSSNLSISGSTLTIDPSADLANNTAFTVEFAAGSIKDLAGNNYAGPTSYNFTTIASAGPQEVEANNTLQTANLIAVNSTVQGAMNANADLDYYKIQLSAGGLLTMNFTHPNGAGTSGGNIRLLFKDNSDRTIAYKDFTGNGKLEATAPFSGDYYVTVMEADKYTTTFTTGIYSVTTNFVSAPNSAYDGADNNDLDTAINKLADGVTELAPGAALTGTMGANADLDYFRIHSSSGGKLTLDFTHPNGMGTSGGNIRLLLKDSDGTVITSKDFTGSGKLDATVPSGGDYYVTVMEADAFTTTFAEGVYSVATSFASVPNSAYDGADNNDLGSAISKLADNVTTLAPGAVLTGTMGANADLDYFRIHSSTGGRLTLDFTHPNGMGTSGGKIRLLFKDSDGTVITSKDFTGSGKLDATIPSGGDYYVTVMEADAFTTTFAEGVYSVATSFTSAPNSAYDGADNNDLGSAVNKLADGIATLTTNALITGTMGVNADLDYFKVSFGAGGPHTLAFTHPNGAGTSGGKIAVQFKDAGGATLSAKDFTGNGVLDVQVPGSGDYYVVVADADNSSVTFAEGIYAIQFVNLIDENFTGDIGNNSFTPGTGNDTIDGKGGIDTSVYSGPRSNFTIAKSGANFIVTDTKGNEGTDTLTNMERLQFADKKLALDLGTNEHAGQALEFIGLLAPGLINAPSVVGTILGIFDQGKSMHDICQFALDLGLVTSLAGSNSNTALAALAFRNLLGFEADAPTINALVGYMDGRFANYTQADFMTVVAGLELNNAHIGLVGLQQTGIEFA